MFDLGLTLRLQDFSLVLKRPVSVVAALFGQIILLPLLAYLIARIFNLPPAFFIGMVLIGCCPGGSSSNLFSKLAGGDVALSVILTALSSIITLITVPVIMSFTTAYVGEATGIVLPVGNLIIQNILLMLIPVIAGIAVHHFFPGPAASIDKVLSKAVFPALLVIITIFFIQHRQTIADHLGTLGLCVCILLVSASALAALMCRLLRLTGKDRRTIVIEVGMQNAAQAIAIASSPFIFNNNEIAVPAILYSLMMNIILLIYVGFVRKRER